MPRRQAVIRYSGSWSALQPYHPLGDASPAHGAADPAFCMPADFFGKPRTHCDIGATESDRAGAFGCWRNDSICRQECAIADQIIAANTD